LLLFDWPPPKNQQRAPAGAIAQPHQVLAKLDQAPSSRHPGMAAVICEAKPSRRFPITVPY
jgi:hypothetical protein